MCLLVAWRTANLKMGENGMNERRFRRFCLGSGVVEWLWAVGCWRAAKNRQAARCVPMYVHVCIFLIYHRGTQSNLTARALARKVQIFNMNIMPGVYRFMYHGFLVQGHGPWPWRGWIMGPLTYLPYFRNPRPTSPSLMRHASKLTRSEA